MKFSPLFHDHAVLQRDISIPVWGFAAPKELVTVSLGDQNARITSGSDGRWLVRFAPQSAGGPYELKAESASGQVIAQDILIGDVWLCSGQSNMEWKLGQSVTADGPSMPEMPDVRVLTVKNPAHLVHHQEEIEGRWAVGNAQALLDFSGVGAWFGHELHRELGIPIGLICTAWGGTRIQAWISRESMMQDPAGREEIATFEREVFTPVAPKESYADFGDWERRGAPQDLINEGLKKGWASVDLDHSLWPSMPLPGRWQDRGHAGNGIFWFRHTVTIPNEWAGRDLELHLGQIDKHDDTWVNGERIGGLSWEAGPNAWCTPRIYTVPGHLINSNRRVVIAVRARSHVFHGGLIGPADEMYLLPAGESKAAAISVAGAWNYAVEQDWGIVTPPTAVWTMDNPNSPSNLFASRVTPLVPYAIRGVIWYQGESNASEAKLYRRLMPLLIRDWRHAWGQGDFPFLQVQLANFLPAAFEPGPSQWAELREAQASALSEPNTGMAVAIDVGEAGDIHPHDKRSVGLRLARWALAKFYGKGGMPSGPLFARADFEATGQVRIHFHHASGLHFHDKAEPRLRDGNPFRHVAIAGDDKTFKWASCRIEGETLVVWHPDISRPVATRYAWADNTEGSDLVNALNLPASPFRTDAW